ncbi:SDR family oxidoreductase [Neptuniibacter sp. QD34_54]|uniref:SDR family oxidoreductase n=1 Tax=Neptuniibacter sp. QD34_54 TaxID=3398208 RepID=UPI0039F58AB7
MILVTGATGNVGSHVVDMLIKESIPVRVTTRDENNIPDEWIGNVDVFVTDFNNPNDINSAFDSVEGLILITPANEEMEIQQKNIVESAKVNGVKRIIKLSGLGAGPDAEIRLPKAHYKIEEFIKASGIDYIFVRPNLFMQTLMGSYESIVQNRAIYAPAGTGKISFIDAQDIAAVIVSALCTNEFNRSIDITGPDAVSYTEIASKLSNATGSSVEFVDVTESTAKESMLASGLSDWLSEAFLELFQVYRANLGSAVLSHNIKAETGTTVTTIDQFIQNNFQTN